MTIIVSISYFQLQINFFLQILKILQGDPVEHRNIPCEEGFKFMYKFHRQRKDIINSENNRPKNPENVNHLLTNLISNQSVTSFQYDLLIKFLMDQREHQRKLEVGEISVFEKEPSIVMTAPTSGPMFDSQSKLILQRRIQDILNRRPIPHSNVTDIKAQLISNEKFQQALKVFKSGN